MGEALREYEEHRLRGGNTGREGKKEPEEELKQVLGEKGKKGKYRKTAICQYRHYHGVRVRHSRF